MTKADAVKEATRLLNQVSVFREKLYAAELHSAGDRLSQVESNLRWIIKNDAEAPA